MLVIAKFEKLLLARIVFFISFVFLFFSSCQRCELEEIEIYERKCPGLIWVTELGSSWEMELRIDSVASPLSDPFLFAKLRIDSGIPFQRNFSHPSNFSAFDRENYTYFLRLTEENRFFKYDIKTNELKDLGSKIFAPIHYNGRLYAVSSAGGRTVTIVEVDKNDGSLTTLAETNTIGMSFFYQYLSSTSDEKGNLYFVSGHLFFKYSTKEKTIEVNDLKQESDVVRHFGAQYVGNSKLAVVRNSVNTERSDILLFDVNDFSKEPELFFNLIKRQIAFNPIYYSTTFNSCSNKYYFVTRHINENIHQANFFEIDMSDKTWRKIELPRYPLGIQSME